MSGPVEGHTSAAVEHLLSTKEAADVLGLSPRTLEDWRWRGGGPRFLTLSRNVVRYRHADLMLWATRRAHASTHERRFSEES